MPRADASGYRTKVTEAERLRCVLGRRAAAGGGDPAGRRRSSPTRCGRPTTSRSSRSSTPASTTCGSPPGTAARPPAARAPAIMFLPGYQMDPPIPKEWARKGYFALSVAPRGKLRSIGQFNPGYPNLLTHNIVDRHTYAYRGFYVDTWRGIDFLLSRPEVDPARIGVTGSSQGGGLTITTAAMRPEVRAAAAGAPYLCGYMDAIELTHTYPYEEINDYLRAHPERRPRGGSDRRVLRRDQLRRPDPCPIIVNIGFRTTSVRRRPATRCSSGSAPRTSSSIPTTATATTPAAYQHAADRRPVLRAAPAGGERR